MGSRFFTQARGQAIARSCALAVLAIAAALVVACGGGSAEPTPVPTEPPMTEIQLTDGDDGANVQLALGGVLVVALASNPTTGYSWSVSEPAAGELALQGEPRYVPAGSTTAVPGAGGTEVFTFEAVAAGNAILTLEYRRPFEPAAPAESTFTVSVLIR